MRTDLLNKSSFLSNIIDESYYLVMESAQNVRVSTFSHVIQSLGDTVLVPMRRFKVSFLNNDTKPFQKTFKTIKKNRINTQSVADGKYLKNV